MPSPPRERMRRIVEPVWFERAIPGINVDTMQSRALSDAHAEREAMLNETGNVLGEIRALRAEVAELHPEMRKPWRCHRSRPAGRRAVPEVLDLRFDQGVRGRATDRGGSSSGTAATLVDE